jgi:outer membrane biogenesis lipoprotein LolB
VSPLFWVVLVFAILAALLLLACVRLADLREQEREPVMRAWQRRQLMRERAAGNPRLRIR